MLRFRRTSLFVVLGLSLGLLFLAALGVQAGGWAVVTLDRLPLGVAEGEPVTVDFTVRAHGKTLVDGLSPAIRATHVDGSTSFGAKARDTFPGGHYRAQVVFPKAGQWRWSIDPYGSFGQPMPDLNVASARPQPAAGTGRLEQAQLAGGLASLLAVAGAGAMLLRRRSRFSLGLALIVGLMSISLLGWSFGRPASSGAGPSLPATAEIGQALFLAKGCVICHQHQAVSEARREFDTFNVGPNLSGFSAEPAYLRLWLKKPAAVKSTATMPDLGLSEDEIEALIAFLNASRVPATSGQVRHRPDGLDMPKSKSPSEPFFVRTNGAAGPLVAYDMANGQERFRLPAGMPSADGKRYYVTVPLSRRTSLYTYDPRLGRLLRMFTFDGQWVLSGVSPSGSWVALSGLVGEQARQTWAQTGGWQTTIQIVNAASGQVVHSLALGGNFEVEALSEAGDALFLIQHLPAVNPTQYQIRLYDLATEQLQIGALRAKTAADELMTGLAWGTVASPDGRWLLTLYLNTARNVAFIHALNLQEKFPLCIDLPSGDGDFELLQGYTLAISPAGQTVFAANPKLGVVAEVRLDSFQVTRRVEFAAPAEAGTTPEANLENGYRGQIPAGQSLISRDGQTFFFSNGRQVWAYDTVVRDIDRVYYSQTPITGLGLSPDGRYLYLALEGRPPLAIPWSAERGA